MENKKSLLEEIIDKKSDPCEENRKLWSAAKDTIVPAVTEHLTRIPSQMPDYDIHDKSHSEKVIEIIEKILADKLESLSFYELILLYLSAYLHDSGMALPDWEYETLKIVEKCDKYSPSTSRHKLKSYFQSSKKSDIAKNILKHLNFKYKDHESYIFIEDSEEKVIENISDLIGEYESFRDSYATQLKDKSNDYDKLSEEIRFEFIRQRHHEKVAANIKNLNGKIKDDIKNAVGPVFLDDFLKDLEEICLAHGKDFDYIKTLPAENELDNEGTKNNIQFLAEMLRLGDIIHFSYDRAPSSLFAEKLINKDSLKHWKMKKDLRCSVRKEKKKNKIRIYFATLCEEPETYYFLIDYIKEIEKEIRNFNSLKDGWETLENKEAYSVNLCDDVCKKNIKCENFDPDPDLKFTMDQSKILELLMGVQLYKDKFACLREVYQNALDTSKCLLAYNKKRGVSENIDIKFGVGEEDVEGSKRRYIYCLDHGLGMNKEIIKKYLLHIGNSYYKSKDFDKENAKWDFDVKPTSQFGIGILSCYMIADKIGISTIYYEKQEKTSCVLSGISERFYYINEMSRTDEEKIGNHGTIVKLYLKDEYACIVNSDDVPEMKSFLAETHDFINYDENLSYDLYDRTNVEMMKNNLFYILFQYIGIPHSEIPVCIDTSDGKKPLYQYNQVVDHKDDMTRECLNKLKEYYPDNFEEYIKNIEFIRNYVIETKTESVVLYTLLSLPKKGIVGRYESMLNYIHLLGNNLCVDGIAVEENTRGLVDCLGFNEDWLHYTIVNFCGENRPKLSIDRNSCEFPKFSDDELAKLKSDFLLSIENKIKNHLSEEGISSKDREFLLVYQFLSFRYPSIASKLLADIIATLKEDVFFPDAGLNMLKIKDVISMPEIEIKDLNFQKYQTLSKQLILGKCVNANSISILNDDLCVKGLNYDFISSHDRRYYYEQECLSLSTCVIRADKWEGKYEEYDLVTSFWPIINPNLFDKLNSKKKQNKITSHCKTVDSFVNGVKAIAQLDPILIDSAGIGERKRFFRDKSRIAPDTIRKNFRLSELSNFRETVRKEKKSPTLFAYIAPRKLNDSEESLLKARKRTDPKYVKGVKDGWSIYFLGEMQEYIIVPGIISRADIEKKITKKYKTKTPDISYFDTNDKTVIQAEKGKKNK